MYSASKSARSNRNSVFKKSNTQAIISLRAKIKSLDKSGDHGSSNLDYDPYTYGVEVTQEQIIIYDKSKTIRRAYLLENPYKIGWVVDCDLHVCMLCWREFAWYRGRTKHHCRACGALVCHDCSPYVTDIPMLMEEKGSRVCKNCFGLKSGIFTPLGNESPKPRPAALDATSTNLFETPTQSSANNTPSRTAKRINSNKLNKLESEEKIMQKYLEEMEKIDQEQLPKYEEAYRIMREIIPLDIYKTKVTRLIRRGLPEDCANRIWNTKILWLIVTHPEDIKKIHLADFRSKYFYDGLDIVEMRAIWYNLPKWNFQSDNPLEKGKAEWRDGFKSKLDDLAYKEAIGKLSPQHIRHTVYEEVDYLHLFDPTLPLLPRFHRSASYNQNAILSPAGDDPMATPEPTDQYSPFCDPIENIQDRKKKYMNNFAAQSGSEERREKKYRTLLEEINAEPIEDIYEDDEEYYGEQLEYDDEEEEVEGGRDLRRGEDDISSLEDGSTDELYAQRQQRPYSNQQGGMKEKDNDSRASSSYKTPLNNKQQKSMQSSNADLSGPGRNSGKKYASPAAGKSLHSAQAIHSAMMKDSYSHSSDNAPPTKSAMKQSIPTNQSVASSVSTLSNPPYGKPAPSLATTNTVKFKSAEIPVQQAPNSASKAEKGYKERMSKSLQSSSALTKAFSFHGEGSSSSPMVGSYQNTSSMGNKRSLDSNRMSPLRVTSNNTLASRNRSTSGAGKRDLSPTQLLPTTSGLSQSLMNSPSEVNNRDYPILKPRISLETPTNASMALHGLDPYATPNSIETIPGQYYQPTNEKWKSSNRKFTTINHVDLETPASTTFTTVDSIKSYKFLSTSKKRIPNINDFDSPNIFNNQHVYQTDEEGEEDEESGSHPVSSLQSPMVSTPVIAPNTNYIPVSSAKNAQTTLRYQTPTNTTVTSSSQRTPSATLRPFTQSNNNTTTATTTQGRSTSRAVSSNGLPSHTPSTINTNNPNLTLQKLRYKEEIRLYLLIGNITKTISVLNETNTRLSDYFTTPEATDLLWQCLNPDNSHNTDIPLINQTILFLLDEKMIDINSQNHHHHKVSILQLSVLQDNEYLGRELIRRGADILLCDQDGLSPLSISLTYHYDWLMSEFTASGRELQLLSKGSSDMKFQYLTFFILAGYAKKASEIVEEGYVKITPEEATELLSSCRGNFQNMKDPIETFELLETLGASMVDFE